MLGYTVLKTCLPDHQTTNMDVIQTAALYVVTCTVCLHLVWLKMLY